MHIRMRNDVRNNVLDALIYYSINKGNVDRNDAFYKTIESSVIGKLREKLNFASRYSRRLKTIRLTYFLHWLWASGCTPSTFKKLKKRTTSTLRWLKKNLTGNKLRTDNKLFKLWNCKSPLPCSLSNVQAIYSKSFREFFQSIEIVYRFIRWTVVYSLSIIHSVLFSKWRFNWPGRTSVVSLFPSCF